MKIVSTLNHGIGDYVGGALLLLAPNIFGFADMGGPAVLIPRLLGIVILVQALCTDYEVGLMKLISMKTHLAADYCLSLFLAVSPWLFGFEKGPMNTWLPHVVMGVAIFAVSLVTETVPLGSRREFSDRGVSPSRA